MRVARLFTVILGGARSGKSAYAETLAKERAGDSVVFVATAEALDAEMKERIAAHKAGRPVEWDTLEAPTGVASALQRRFDSGNGTPRMVIVDCLTLLVSNVLMDTETKGQSTQMAQNRVDHELESLFLWQRSSDASLILVSNEVGLGIVPIEPSTRAYRDILGRSNARAAAGADEVFFMVAGIPVPIHTFRKS